MIDRIGHGSAGLSTSWKHRLSGRLLLKQHQELSAGGWRAVGGSSGCHSLISSTRVPYCGSSRASSVTVQVGTPPTPTLPEVWPQPCLLHKATNASPSSGLKSLGQIAETSLKILKWIAFTQTVIAAGSPFVGFWFWLLFLTFGEWFSFHWKDQRTDISEGLFMSE